MADEQPPDDMVDGLRKYIQEMEALALHTKVTLGVAMALSSYVDEGQVPMATADVTSAISRAFDLKTDQREE